MLCDHIVDKEGTTPSWISSVHRSPHLLSHVASSKRPAIREGDFLPSKDLKLRLFPEKIWQFRGRVGFHLVHQHY